jgi:transposase
MNFQRGADRSQVQLLPPCIDDYVPSNAPARFIDAFVEKLDLKTLGFTHAETASTGRPPYHPGDLIRLYIYGYLNRIRSSRRLEAEAGRNLELIWLLGGLKPDFKTIADFRKSNGPAFKALFKQFNLLCRTMDLFGAELVAIDGAKFKAVNSPRRHYTREKLVELIQKIEARIEEYLGELDRQDIESSGVSERPSREALEQKIAQLKERGQDYGQLVTQMEQNKESEVSLTDPDSRGMKKVGVGYNVQMAVDAKHDLIVAQEVVQAANDRGQLKAMAVAAKEALEVATLQAVADGGYHEADQLEGCEQAGIETIVAGPGSTSGQSRGGQKVYAKEDFHYDEQRDCYVCPAGQDLRRGHVGSCKGKERIHYYHRAACNRCDLKAQCTQAPYRMITRRLNEAVVERQEARLAANPKIMAERKTIIEHVFGTLRHWGHDIFLMQGLNQVKAEFSLSCLTYNFRRVLNLKTIEELIEAVGQAGAKPTAA